jgi:hypothetical protein
MPMAFRDLSQHANVRGITFDEGHQQLCQQFMFNLNGLGVASRDRS